MGVPGEVVWLVLAVAALGVGPALAAVLLTGRAVTRLWAAVRVGRGRAGDRDL